jgi:uncharacterized protein YbbC (DUF1343 family)
VNGRRATLLLTALVALSCHASTPVRTGADMLLQRHMDLLNGHRIGLITNQTGVLSSGTSLVDTLVALGVRVTALFSPEHGIRGTAPAGAAIRDTFDARTGIPVYSLYAGTHKPTAAMLRDVDVLVYDLQDAGARFFTYISTMKLAMEAAAEQGLSFIVLDRPNPLGGTAMLGPVLEDSLRSFVGLLPVPIVYGLTCGELAEMINGERWLAGGVRVALTVVRMEGWRRSMRWDDTGLPWIRPSPNLVSPQSALLYPGVCLVEATNLSEGRGTEDPFRMIGAPFVESARLLQEIAVVPHPGVAVTAAVFTPLASKYAETECRGIRLEVTDPAAADPVFTAMGVMQAFRRAHPDSVKIDRKALGRLAGSVPAVDGILNGIDPAVLRDGWTPRLLEYRAKASKYLIYPD